MFKKSVLLVAASSLVLGGCKTTLDLERANSSKIQSGVPYELHYDQFKGNVTFRLSNCETGEFKVTAQITKNLKVPDPTLSFVIDPTSMSSFVKKGDVKLEYYSNGQTKSLNASATDESTAIITSLAETAIGLGLLGSASGSSGKSVADQIREESGCKGHIFDAVQEYDATEKKIKALTRELNAANAALKATKKTIDSLTPNVGPILLDRYNDQFQRVKSLSGQIAKARALLALNGKKISKTIPIELPNAIVDGKGNVTGFKYSGEAAALSRTAWETMKSSWFREGSEFNRDYDAKEFTVSYKLSPNDGRKVPVKGYDSDRTPQGVPYRSAVQGNLAMTRSYVKPRENPKNPDKPILEPVHEKLFSKDYSILQFGYLRELPCSSPAFVSSSCSMTFDKNGNLTSAGTKTDSTAGSGVSSTAAAIAQKLSDREKDKLQKEFDILTLQDQIDTLKDKQKTDPDSTDGEAIANLEGQLVEAEAELLLESGELSTALDTP